MKAADLAEDWDEDGEEEKADEKVEKTEKMAEADVDTTPVRKSGRAPKPTEKLLEGKQQVGFPFFEKYPFKIVSYFCWTLFSHLRKR